MMKEIRRRNFLKVSSVLLLAGCAKVTRATNDSRLAQKFFEWFAKKNDQLGQLVFGKNRLAPEFTEADITRPDFKNNYHGITPRMPPDTWFMRLSGKVENPKPFRLEDFKTDALPDPDHGDHLRGRMVRHRQVEGGTPQPFP